MFYDHGSIYDFTACHFNKSIPDFTTCHFDYSIQNFTCDFEKSFHNFTSCHVDTSFHDFTACHVDTSIVRAPAFSPGFVWLRRNHSVQIQGPLNSSGKPLCFPFVIYSWVHSPCTFISSVEVAGWIPNHGIRVWFPAYPHHVWALWYGKELKDVFGHPSAYVEVSSACKDPLLPMVWVPCSRCKFRNWTSWNIAECGVKLQLWRTRASARLAQLVRASAR